MYRNTMNMLQARWAQGCFVCVGLDPVLKHLPLCLKAENTNYNAILKFLRDIVDATAPVAAAFKPNIAFFEGIDDGLLLLETIIAHIITNHPKIPVILDAKRGDIGSTNDWYVESIFNRLKADATTIAPYLGGRANAPFLGEDKLSFVLCSTSNAGADEFQSEKLVIPRMRLDSMRGFTDEIAHQWGLTSDGICYPPLYQFVAYRVANHWNNNGNCGLVVGATAPAKINAVRKIVGDMPLLIPGIGAQGGDVKNSVEAAMDSKGQGFIINSSRAIIYASDASDYAEAAAREVLRLSDEINQYRN